MLTSVVDIRVSKGAAHLAEKTPRGADKLLRYGWTAGDEPGTFQLIHKEQLSVDHSYQRDSKESLRKDITQDFSWAAFGALQVAERIDDNGRSTYVIFDGQNRWEGSLRRSDITHLPCMVYRVQNIEQEAKSFLTTNTGRKAVSAIEKHKASVLTGDHVSVVLNSLVANSAYKISYTTGPARVKCVALCKKLIVVDEDLFGRVWHAMVYITERGHLHERLLDGLFYLARNAEQDVLSREYLEKMRRIGAADLLNSINSAAAYYARGGARVFADGLMQRVNKSARTQRITMKSDA